MKTYRLFLLLIWLFPAVLAGRAAAGSHTWTGLGISDNWSEAANWLGGAPAAAEAAPVTLIFPDGVFSRTPIDNVPGVVVNLMTVDGGNWIFSGASSAKLTFAGGVTDALVITDNGLGTQFQANLPVVLASGARFNINNNLIVRGIISGAGGITLNGGTLQIEGTADNTCSGPMVVNTGSLTLQKSAGVDAFAGPLTLAGGTASLNADEQIPDGVTVTMNSLTRLYVNAKETVGPMNLTGALIQGNGAATRLTLGGNVTSVSSTNRMEVDNVVLPADRTFTVSAGRLDLGTDTTVVSGAGGIVKNGAGTLALLSANTFGGALTLHTGGCLTYSIDAFGATTGGVTVDAGTTLTLLTGGTLTVGAETLNLAGTLSYFTDVIWNGPIVLSGPAATFDGAGSAEQPDNFTHTGVMSGTGTLVKTGIGSLFLAGSSANTWSGGTQLNAGIVYLNKSIGNAIPGNLTLGGAKVALMNSQQIADGAAMTINSGAFDLGSRIETIASLAGATGRVTFSLGTLTVGGNNASTAYNGLLSGYGTNCLVKNGTGTLTLQNTYISGGNTLTGALAVNGGTLTLNGDHASPVTVTAGGFLNGNGSVGDVTVFGKVCLCTLKTKSLIVSGASAQVLGNIQGVAGGVNHDQMKVTGTVNLTGSTFAPVLGYVPFAGASYLLIDNDGTDAVTGTFNGLAEGAALTLNGKSFSITYQGGTGNDVVLRFTGPGLAPPVITAISWAPVPGSMPGKRTTHIEVLAPPSIAVNLQYSQDLQTWLPHASGNTDGQGRVNFDAISFASSPRFFYRAVVP